MERTPIQRLAESLRDARSVVVLTGAGVSAESGLPTFRAHQKAMGSLWKDFAPMKLATPEAFEADPEMVTRWYDWRRLGCLSAEPNAGHVALAELERRMRASSNPQSAIPNPQSRFTLLTQNVD